MHLSYIGMDDQGQKLVAFTGWVGRCDRCNALTYIMNSNVLYTNGKLSGWASANTNCIAPACRDHQLGAGEAKVRPLSTLAEQEPYQAAYSLGGWEAVYAMLDQKPAKILL